MLSSCETALTESSFSDTEVAGSAGQIDAVSGSMRIEVSEEIAEKLLASRDAQGVISSVALSEVGLGPEDGFSSVSTTFMIGGKFEQRQKSFGLHRWFDVMIDPDVVRTKAENDLKSVPGVGQVEQVVRLKPLSVMDDPDFSRQWHYLNLGDNGFRAGIDIKLEDAWERYEVYGSPEVIVAVIDNGIDVTHPDLAGNLWVNEAEANGVEGVDDDRNGYVDDIHGYNFVKNSPVMKAGDHGTHVAGTVAAVNNNGIGVCGVAGGKWPEPGVRIMALQLLGDENDPPVSFTTVMQYAAENGAVIAQNSWGYADDVKTILASDRMAIDYFVSVAGCDSNGDQTGPMQGGLVVFAAGNDTVDYGYPAGYEKCLAVAAIGPTGAAGYYSNYGDWVDVCAPGGDMQVNRSYGGVFSTINNGDYGSSQGTSMACPHVSGLAALVLSVTKGPGYTADMLYDHMVSTTDPSIYKYNASKDGMLGSGMIDAVRALAKLSTVAPSAPTSVDLEISSNEVYFTLDMPLDEDDKYAFFYNIYVSDKEISDADKASAQKFTFDIEAAEDVEGGLKRVLVKGLAFDSELHYAVSASDFAGNESPLALHGTLTTKSNSAPVIEINDDSPISVPSYDMATRTFTYSEPDGHAFSVEFSSTAVKGIEYTEVSETIGVVRIDGTASDKGKFEFTITVTDEFGLANSMTCEYVIQSNTPPVLVKKIEDVTVNGVGASLELDFNKYFSDADNEPLSARFDVADKDIVSASFNNGKIVLKGKTIGQTSVKVTASDGAGESVSSEFAVLVRDASKPYDLYPNPVTDVLNIRAGEDRDAKVKIFSATGQTVYEADARIGMFDVFTADLSTLAPGRYNILIQSGGERYNADIVKL